MLLLILFVNFKGKNVNTINVANHTHG